MARSVRFGCEGKKEEGKKHALSPSLSLRCRCFRSFSCFSSLCLRTLSFFISTSEERSRCRKTTISSSLWHFHVFHVPNTRFTGENSFIRSSSSSSPIFFFIQVRNCFKFSITVTVQNASPSVWWFLPSHCSSYCFFREKRHWREGWGRQTEGRGEKLNQNSVNFLLCHLISDLERPVASEMSHGKVTCFHSFFGPSRFFSCPGSFSSKLPYATVGGGILHEDRLDRGNWKLSIRSFPPDQIFWKPFQERRG